MKRRINAAYDERCVGRCSEAERAVVLYLAMQESNLMDETDTSKGSAQPASNFCPFNMNVDFLSLVGCDLACAQALGQRYAEYDIPSCVRYLLRGLRGEWEIRGEIRAGGGAHSGSACGFLDFHRGGRTGFDNAIGAQSCVADCGYFFPTGGGTGSGVACGSAYGSAADPDSTVRGCEDWCSVRDAAEHCSWCKCRGCTGGRGSPDCSSADPLEPWGASHSAAFRPALPAGAVLLGCRAFKDAVADGSNRILADPALVHDGRRVCMMIRHVRRRVGEEEESTGAVGGTDADV